MNERMSKTRFLDMMQSARERWDSLLAQIDEAEMERPGATGRWSARDIVAHVTAYERGLVKWLESARRGESKIFSDLDHPDVNHRNVIILEQIQGCTLEQIKVEAEIVFGQLLELVGAIPEEELIGSEQAEWYVRPRWGAQRALWECIADDSYRHYAQHIGDIRRWLEGLGQGS